MKKILYIPKINIHNANALSSPYTIGFPAMTAWGGGVHAIERKLHTVGYPGLTFKNIGVACHHINLQTYKGTGDYVSSLIINLNPLKKNGEKSSFIEEARCHLTVSLIIEYECPNLDDTDKFINIVENIVHGNFKLAGGDILNFNKIEIIQIEDKASGQKFLQRLMPSYCLVDRRDLMIKSMEEGRDAIDALLDHLKVTQTSKIEDTGEIKWSSHRKDKGWIVPISIGYQGITDICNTQDQRDRDTPHRFAESVVSLGQFIMPYRFTNIEEILWQYNVDLDKNLYMYQQIK